MRYVSLCANIIIKNLRDKTMRLNYLTASRYFITVLLGLNLFFGNAYSATSCCNPIRDPVVLERDKIYGLVSMAMIYKDWQTSSNGRGHNIGSILVRNSDNMPVFWARNSVNVRHNSSQHGEVRLTQAFLDFCQSSNPSKYIKDFTLYSTLEPCAMCTGMLAMTQLSRAVFVQVDPEYGRALRGLQLVKFPRVFAQNTTPGLPQKTALEAGWVNYRAANPGSAITDYLLSSNARDVYASAEQSIRDMTVLPANQPIKDAALSFLTNRVGNEPEVFGDAMAARCP